MTKNEKIALQRYNNNEKFNTSTFIDEDMITAGYGQLSHIGEFEFPLSNSLIKKIFKTNSWKEYYNIYDKEFKR
jgi:hypothetical protein